MCGNFFYLGVEESKKDFRRIYINIINLSVICLLGEFFELEYRVVCFYCVFISSVISYLVIF